MRIIDDNITPDNSSWSAVQTKRERETEGDREREIEWQGNKREREQEEEGTERERERELQMFFMMGFDSAISRFLPLLVNKSYRKKSEKGKT